MNRILRKRGPRLSHLSRQLRLRRRVRPLDFDLRRPEDQGNLRAMPGTFGVRATRAQRLVRELAAVEVPPCRDSGVAPHLRGETGGATRGLVGRTVDLGARGSSFVIGVTDENGL
jgi:hypothetical protein